MPEGLHAGLSAQEFADLIDYLASLSLPESAAAGRHGCRPTSRAERRRSTSRPFHSAEHRFEHPVWFGPVPGCTGAFAVVEHETGKVWLLDKADASESKGRLPRDRPVHARHARPARAWSSTRSSPTTAGTSSSSTWSRTATSPRTSSRARRRRTCRRDSGRPLPRRPPDRRDDQRPLRRRPRLRPATATSTSAWATPARSRTRRGTARTCRCCWGRCSGSTSTATTPASRTRSRRTTRSSAAPACGRRSGRTASASRGGSASTRSPRPLGRRRRPGPVRGGRHRPPGRELRLERVRGVRAVLQPYRRDGERVHRRRSSPTPASTASPSPAGSSTAATRSRSFYGVYVFGDYQTKRIFGLTQEDRVLKTGPPDRHVAAAGRLVRAATSAGSCTSSGTRGRSIRSDLRRAKFE